MSFNDLADFVRWGIGLIASITLGLFAFLPRREFENYIPIIVCLMAICLAILFSLPPACP